MFFESILIISLAITTASGSNPCNPVMIADRCPPMWQLWGNSCYRLTPKIATWDSARAACLDMEGEMAAPRSLEENEFIASMAREASLTYLWVACNDRKIEGEWKCKGQGDIFFNWAVTYGEPNNADGDENCAYMTAASAFQGKWFDWPCSITLQAACVRRPIPVPQPPPRHYRFSISDDPLLLNSCLVDHTIREFVIDNALSCASACIKEPGCRSINIKISQEGEKVCQLNDSTRTDDPANFKNTDYDCIFYSVSIE